MDPISVILGILAITAGTAIIFWQEILGWAEESLFPWIKSNFPFMEDQVRLAFSEVDKIATPIRLAVKEAWAKLREFLLKETVELERKSSSEWIKRVTSWVVKVLESGRKTPAKVVTEEIVNWDHVPQDVREAFLRLEQDETEFNVTEMRDRELAEMEMTT